MRSIFALSQSKSGFIAGFVMASTLVGGLGLAADALQREIQVAYVPLKYIFDGTGRTPPSDQQGFIYNGRTYVPLRFIAESVGKAVAFDPETYTIYVGRRPATVPQEWTAFKVEGPAATKLEHFPDGVQTITGSVKANALLFTSVVTTMKDTSNLTEPTTVSTEMNVPDGASQWTGTLFVPVEYFGHAQERGIGNLSVLDEKNTVLYTSDLLKVGDPSVVDPSINFTVQLRQAKRLRVFVNLYANQGLAEETLLVTRLGLAGLQFQ